MLVTGLCSVTAYSADKINALDALKKIQTTTGFIPGKTAKVTNNCYGFISAVCEKLYGVGYNGEGLHGNYMCTHSSGNYYTVATYKNTSSSMTSASAKDIMNFFMTNAMPGDVIHYGTLTSSSSNSSTHTFMIQSVDTDKMQIYHSNYETADYPRSSCHIDNIIWSSFLENPTKTQYNSNGNMISLNAIFYNKMKSGGLGITINRYSKYLDIYNQVGPTIPVLSASNKTSTSLSVSWKSIIGAEKYEVRYKKADDKDYKVLSNSITKTSCSITNLKTGSEYNLKARAYVNGKWRSFSSVKTIKVLPPVVKSLKPSLDKNGIVLRWTPSADCTGYYVYRSETKDGTYKRIKQLTNPDNSECLDKAAQYGKKYYYRVDAYKSVSPYSYSNASSVVSCTYKISAPELTVNRSSTTGLKLSFPDNPIVDRFIYSVTDSKGKAVASGETTDLSVNVKGLTVGKSYTCKVAGANAVGCSDYSVINKKCLPPTPSYVNTAPTKSGIEISYPTRSDVTGYIIYRSSSADGIYTKLAQIDDKAVDKYLDKDISYNKTYYYRVKRYVIVDGNAFYGADKQSNGVKIKIESIKNVKAVSKANTAITVSWSKDPLASSYKLLYRKSGETAFKTACVTSNSSANVSGLKLGTYYEFKVCGKNAFGAGGYSDIVKKRALPPKMSAPKLTKQASSIKVSWVKSDYATGYRIYRKTSKSASYELYKTVKSGTSTSFTDKNVKKGKTYYYCIEQYKTLSGKTYYSCKSTSSSIKFE